MIIDPLSLKFFVAIVEEGAIAAVAEREHIAPLAMSKRIKELEERFIRRSPSAPAEGLFPPMPAHPCYICRAAYSTTRTPFNCS